MWESVASGEMEFRAKVISANESAGGAGLELTFQRWLVADEEQQ